MAHRSPRLTVPSRRMIVAGMAGGGLVPGDGCEGGCGVASAGLQVAGTVSRPLRGRCRGPHVAGTPVCDTAG